MISILIDEIERYPWRNPRYHPDKLEASSPIRLDDDRPSFRVITDPDSPAFACWVDSGASDPNRRRGGPVQLYAILTGISETEARAILTENERDGPDEYIHLRLRESLTKPHLKPLDSSLLTEYSRTQSEYLTNRGISAEVQRIFQTGYDVRSQAATFPWIDVAGSLRNVKFRKTTGKSFFYAKSGAPIRDLIYGINVIHARKIKRAAIVESEIDALYLWTIGVPAIATGGAAFNEKKRDLILRSPIEEIIILRDFDKAGRAWRNEVVAAFRGRLRMEIALVPRGFKDVNEARITAIAKTRIVASMAPALRLIA